MTRIAIDETCPGCGWPEMGAELEAPVMTCSRCGSAWLTGRGAGLLLAVIQEERELCDPDDAAADYLQDLLDERDAELGVLAELIAGCAVAMIRPGAQSGDVEPLPGHPVKTGAGYDCQCGACLAQGHRSGDPS